MPVSRAEVARARHGGSRADTSENSSGTSSCFKNTGYSSEAGKKMKEWDFLHFSLV